MSVAVYSRLAALLDQRQMTVVELIHQIKERYGLAVRPEFVDQITDVTAVEQVDLRTASAVAATLGVKLDDLFLVAAVPTDTFPTNLNGAADLELLTPSAQQRLNDLFDKQDQEQLTEDEVAEIRALITMQGRRLHEHRMRELALKQGAPVEEVERESQTKLADALSWWEAYNASSD